jgi:hypothetical protein
MINLTLTRGEPINKFRYTAQSYIHRDIQMELKSLRLSQEQRTFKVPIVLAAYVTKALQKVLYPADDELLDNKV